MCLKVQQQPPSTTPLTRLFDRSEAESRGCTVVAVNGERAEGDWGQIFGVRFAKILLVTYALMTRVRSQLCFALVFLVC